MRGFRHQHMSQDWQESAFKTLTQILANEEILQNCDISYASVLEGMRSKQKMAVFEQHDHLVSHLFGIPDNAFAFNLPEVKVEELSAWLSEVPTTTYAEAQNRQNGPLFVLKISQENAIENLDKNLVLFDLPKSDVITKLHQEIRSQISEYVRSPFSFVNTRAWITKSKSDQFGPNAPHKDGFLPGHMKIMVYLTPLSREFGDFWIEGQVITDQAPGFCLAFKNSDLLHSGKPGTEFPRICFEITIMRTLLESEQKHESHPLGRHFLNVSSAYQDNGKETTAYKAAMEELVCSINELEKSLTFDQVQKS